MRSVSPNRDVLIAVLILVAGVAVVTAMHLMWPESSGTTTTYVTRDDRSDRAGLLPLEITDISGAPVTLTAEGDSSRTVRLNNPNEVDLVLDELRAEFGQPVDEARQPVADCPADLLQAEPVDAATVVAPGKWVDVVMKIRITGELPAACEGVVFPLTYSVRTAPSSGEPGA
ncbi:hypothetical protein V1227_05960 [Lentzea sp. DG1S-22]|uniref:hypothetical protein n=1 Tax=Lentzea sp. DG1S-22 TaxID=3108822 RepID=UPI002E75E74D|nr:hypothetical protein [Lentzea sp. DG1S-22]WVH82302.1 hypothetical protein V1227_05960 [Lentzea sp. DG1S-22]